MTDWNYFSRQSTHVHTPWVYTEKIKRRKEREKIKKGKIRDDAHLTGCTTHGTREMKRVTRNANVDTDKCEDKPTAVRAIRLQGSIGVKKVDTRKCLNI